MITKEFTFRGKNLGELKQLNDEEFAKLVNSRARRTLLKGSNKLVNKRVEEFLVNSQAMQAKGEPKSIRVHNRNIIVTPKMIGLRFGIYNGHEFIPVEIIPEMLGRVFGEFALTRKRLRHGKAGIGATRSSTAITARG